MTDLGLDHLTKNNPSLYGIALRGTQVTSAGLERLSALPRLMWLDLCDTQVTDAAIDSLANCRSLLTVLLDGTEVTDEGVARLREALPDCEVRYRDGLPP